MIDFDRQTKYMKSFNPETLTRITATLLFVLIIPFLLLYNLGTSPRTWHDEGNAMLLAKTLAQDGVYAVKTSTGYQTFGAVQSVGPTVILPVSLSFRLFGVGLLQGRLIAALYSFLTLVIIYKLIVKIFNAPIAIFGILLLLGSTSAQFLYFGRQVLGEVPALGFFLGGWYFWLLGKETKKPMYFGVAGLLIGASMVTKSSYLLIAGAVLVIVTFLDLIYYKLGSFFSLFWVAGISIVIFAIWTIFQRQYYGAKVFGENLVLLGQLGKSTTGFSIHGLVEQVKFLIGAKNDHFYFLWGIPVLIYSVMLCLQRDERGFITCVMTSFSILWLMYYFYSVPWSAYLVAPAAVVALLTGKFLFDLISHFAAFYTNIILEVKTGKPATAALFIALCAGLLMFIFYPLQNAVQFSVFENDDFPFRTANLLNTEVESHAVIETWERELGILTDRQYHYPDQSFLIKVHADKYRSAPQDYLLGYDYFKTVQPAYVVIGKFDREFPIYDLGFLENNSELIAQIGEGPTSYEVYKINYPLVVSK